jgi:predicted nucleotidyltransferase
MDLDSRQVLQLLADQQARLRARGVRRIGLFGSVARDEARPGSDMDFLVEFEPGRKTFDNYMDLKDFLEQLFERRVDLVTSEGIKPQLRDRILSEAIYAPGL